MKVTVEISARHIHLSQADFEHLFGGNANLTIRKELSQPGQFASNERIDVQGPKETIQGVSILGPFRKETQLELSLTDTRKLGISAPIRESGHLDQTPGCTLIGPAGEIELAKGVIVAKRHIHMTPQIAEKECLQNGQIVNVKIISEGRSLIFGETVVRVHENFSEALHIDTDEANAAGTVCFAEAEILV